MKIAFIASESLPFIKTGGLADVISGLSTELVRNGHEVKVFLPLYKKICDENDSLNHVGYFYSLDNYVGIVSFKHNGVEYIFLDNKQFFGRDNIYGYDDDVYRFGLFSRMALDTLGYLSWYPDVVHVHDWHTAIVPFMLKTYHKKDYHYHNIKTVLTVHNFIFQGISDLNIANSLHLERHSDYEFNGKYNALKCGIQTADKITTVSPTYKEETLNGDVAFGLKDILLSRLPDYKGILNGVDYHFFNPTKNDYLEYNYDETNYKLNKHANKEKLYKIFNCHCDLNRPLFIIVSRLTDQKGIHFIQEIMDKLLQEDITLIVIGSGEFQYEKYFAELGNTNKVFSTTEYNEVLAHLAYAAGDFILMPSVFEPCGLSQIIALKFGCIPIVRSTGGLADTIISYNEFSEVGNGFSFNSFSSDDLWSIIFYAISLFYQEEFDIIIKNAMRADFSWHSSMLEYLEIY